MCLSSVWIGKPVGPANKACSSAKTEAKTTSPWQRLVTRSAFGPTPIAGSSRNSRQLIRGRSRGSSQDKQLDRVCRIPDNWASRQQIRCAKAKKREDKNQKPPVGKLTGAFFDVVSCVQAEQTRFLKRSTIRRLKSNLSYLAIIQRCARLTYADFIVRTTGRPNTAIYTIPPVRKDIIKMMNTLTSLGTTQRNDWKTCRTASRPFFGRTPMRRGNGEGEYHVAEFDRPSRILLGSLQGNTSSG